MVIYNLTGKGDIQWQDLKRVKGIREKNINWSTFKKYFKNKFLSKQYYEERAKEFYELKLGTMNMKELNSKFLSLLRYVPYIVDEKPKVQHFFSSEVNVCLVRVNFKPQLGVMNQVCNV